MKTPVLVLVLGLLLAARCVAGTTGVMNGYVRDENGLPVAGVRIQAISPTDRAWTYTDARGFYVLYNLLPDSYIVDAVKAGTSNAFAIGVRINSDQTAFLILHFSSYRHCGAASNHTTLSVDQRSEQFTSLNLYQMQRYPAGSMPPIPLPAVDMWAPRCL